MVKRKPKPLLIILIMAGLFLIIIGGFYIYATSPIDLMDSSEIEVVIPRGTSTNGIAKILKSNDLIHSEAFFSIYVKLKGGSLKASTYKFKKNMGLSYIVRELTSGNTYNENVVTITFKEGQRLTDYAEVIAKNTNNTYDDVINTVNDKTYLTELISNYWFLTDEILDSDIYYPLEGYLAPNTYQFKDSDVSVKDIVKVMLDQMDKELSNYKDSMINYSIHQYITMASIVELEGTNTENRKMIVGVFNNRLKIKMNLGSDVTTYYAIQAPMTSDLTTSQFATVNPYNTRASTMAGKLPVGPICNSSLSALKSSINPTVNDYLYFVADKNGKIYYSKTLSEHEQTIKQIKDKGDWIW